VDLLAYLAMAGLMSTGLIMWGLLPPGTGGGGAGHEALTLLGRTRHQWGTVHWYLALSLIGLVVLHVVLHWKWVTNTIGSLVPARGERKPGAGLVGAVVLAVLGVVAAGVVAAPWLIGVDLGSGGAGKGFRGGRQAQLTCDDCTAACPDAGKAAADKPFEPTAQEDQGQTIRGRMTLAEAAAEAGVPPARLAAELKLPPSTPHDSQLGQLRRQHGFEIEDVRAAVARLKAAPKDKP